MKIALIILFTMNALSAMYNIDRPREAKPYGFTAGFIAAVIYLVLIYGVINWL
jgi:hypothetical protein